MNPTVSVLITLYNREKYVARTIESVLASTYSDFEVIVVDDGSTDQSVEIAQSYEQIDARVKVFVNGTNLGDYPNRNRAASLASGTYLKYVDADDLLYPHALDMLVRSMDRFPNAGFGLTRPPSNVVPYPAPVTPEQIYKEHFLENDRWDGSPLGAIIRQEAFSEVGGFSGRPYVGDLEMWLKLGSRYSAVKLPDGFGFWREHDEQETKYRQSGEAAVRDAIMIYEAHMNALTSSMCPLSQTDREYAICLTKHRFVRFVFWKFRQGQVGIARAIVQKSDLSVKDLIKYFPRPAARNSKA